MVVLCNLDKKKQKGRVAKEWRDSKILLENYEGRGIAPGEEVYTMEPYEFMVLGNVKN